MGWFKFGKKKVVKPMAPAKKARASRAELQQRAKEKLVGARAQAELREIRERETYMRELKSKDPARYARLMEQRLGITSSEDDEAADDPLDIAERTLKRMERFEKTFKRGEGEGESALSTIMNSTVGVAIAHALGPDLLRAFAAKVTGLPPPVDPAAVVTITANPQPVESAAPSAPVLAVEDAQSEASAAVSNSSVLSDGERLIGILDGKSPEQAAEWLTSQQAPLLRQLVMLLRNTHDEQLPALLDELPRRAPQLADFTAWLRQRPQWTLEAVQAVRRSGDSLPSVNVMGL